MEVIFSPTQWDGLWLMPHYPDLWQFPALPFQHFGPVLRNAPSEANPSLTFTLEGLSKTWSSPDDEVRAMPLETEMVDEGTVLLGEDYAAA